MGKWFVSNKLDMCITIVRVGVMKKIILGLTLMLFLTGCAETLAFLGPVGSAATGGNAMHSSLTSAATYGIKKSTGKSALEHASSFAEKHNPGRKKVKCVSFLESTDSEICKILQNKISDLRFKIDKNSKIKNLNN